MCVCVCVCLCARVRVSVYVCYSGIPYVHRAPPLVAAACADVRGLEGPVDLFVLHALLRVIAPPPAVTAGGGALPRGEALAAAFAAWPPGLVKAAWEDTLRRAAAPVVAKFRSLGLRTAGDVQGLDLVRAGVEPLTAGVMGRMLRALRAAATAADESTARGQFAKPALPKEVVAAAAAARARAPENSAFFKTHALAQPARARPSAGSISRSGSVVVVGGGGGAPQGGRGQASTASLTASGGAEVDADGTMQQRGSSSDGGGDHGSSSAYVFPGATRTLRGGGGGGSMTLAESTAAALASARFVFVSDVRPRGDAGGEPAAAFENAVHALRESVNSLLSACRAAAAPPPRDGCSCASLLLLLSLLLSCGFVSL